MEDQQPESTIPMAQQALAEYDEKGEEAFIVMLGQLAHPAQTHETWRDAGVCVLADGTAVVQGLKHYEFRWGQVYGSTHVDREANIPMTDRQFRWFHHGPLQHWPAGINVWQDVDEILTVRALDAMDARGVNVSHVTDGDRSEIPMVTFMKACPQLGALMDAAMEQQPDLPEWLAGTIGDHVRECAHSVIENLHENDLDKAVNAVAFHLSATAPEDR